MKILFLVLMVAGVSHAVQIENNQDYMSYAGNLPPWEKTYQYDDNWHPTKPQDEVKVPVIIKDKERRTLKK